MDANGMEGSSVPVIEYLVAGAAIVSEDFLTELHRTWGRLDADFWATAHTMCYHSTGKNHGLWPN